MQQDPGPLVPPPLNSDGTPSIRTPERTANLIRFQSELEFIQCLSNPLYLHELHTQNYLSQPEFTNYLSYLSYWRQPEYIRFITYPTCLVYLSLLQSESFRARLGDMAFINDLIRIGRRHHETWRVTKPPDRDDQVVKQEEADGVGEAGEAQDREGDDEDGDGDGQSTGGEVKIEQGAGQSGKRKKKNKAGKSKLGQEQTPVPAVATPTKDV